MTNLILGTIRHSDIVISGSGRIKKFVEALSEEEYQCIRMFKDHWVYLRAEEIAKKINSMWLYKS